MTTTLRALGITGLCLAGWLTVAAIACDMAGSALIHLGGEQ